MSMIAAVLLLSSLQGPGEPTLPPTIELTGFTGIEASSFGDFFGRPVLLDFFAHWCAPCARQVPHLNDLQERYSGRGLVVLGVTSESPADIDPWIAEHRVAFPHAFDPDLRLQIELGFHPLPYALLIDPAGAVVWSGNPAELEEGAVEQALVGALPVAVREWPAELDQVRRELTGGRYGAALSALRSAPDSELTDAIEHSIHSLLEERAAIAEAALERGDLLAAKEIEEAMLPATEGLEVAARFAAVTRAVERDESGVLEAQIELRELWRGVHEVDSKRAADELHERISELAEAYPGTIVEIQAAAHGKALDNLKGILR